MAEPSNDPWLLPDDHIVDHVAIDVASRGLTPLRLTARERKIIALILRETYPKYIHYGGQYTLPELLKTRLSLSCLDDAKSILKSLPTGRAAKNTVLYWTNERYRRRVIAENIARRRKAKVAARAFRVLVREAT